MNKGDSVGTDPAPRPARIGIFRRVAVERYSQPIEIGQPDLLAPWRAVAKAAGLALCFIGIGTAIFAFGCF